MLQLIPTGEVRVGDRIMPEEYDEHVGLDGYDECCAEEVVRIDRVGMYQVRVTTSYEAATFDRDDEQMVVRGWVADGRDSTDLS